MFQLLMCSFLYNSQRTGRLVFVNVYPNGEFGKTQEMAEFHNLS